MYTLDLKGTHGVVFGVANHRSLAWSIAQSLAEAGATRAFTYAGDRLKEKVEGLAAGLPGSPVLPCDVTRDEEIAGVFARLRELFGSIDYVVHSVAFANKED